MPSSPSAESIRIPPTAPVMVLPECNLLPHGLLPLFIFEPRYREMLHDALAGPRVFCIGMRRPSPAGFNPEDDEAVLNHSAIGLIRASVAHDDGTSHLILQGLRRVRFVEWIGGRSYRVARIETVKSRTTDPIQAEALATKLLELAKRLVENGMEISDQLKKYLSSLEDPETIADIVAYNFIPCPHARHHLLETPDVGDRLRYVIDHLNRTLSQLGLS